jgi:hypothetical protein
MTDETKQTLSELALHTAVYLERAPGRAEKRMVLFKAFVEAHRLNPAVTDDPALTLLDMLLDQPHLLVRNLLTLWIGEA